MNWTKILNKRGKMMAIERNDVNFLTDIQIKSENNRRFFQDVRSLIFFTKDFAIEPTYITKPQDVLDLKVSGLDENHDFYKFIASAYGQSYTPVNVIVYGNNVATTFTEAITTYKNHAKAFEVTNWLFNMDVKTKKAYVESIVAYAKTDKMSQFAIAIEIEKLTDVNEAIKYQTDSNIENVAYFIEGANNVAKGNWLTSAVFGGHIGSKTLGSYIVHSLQINGFVQEEFTPSEQVLMKGAGLNFLSKPTRGYFHLVNGLNSDNKTFIELNLIRIWLKDGLDKDLIVYMVTKDKIDNNDTGKSEVYAVIRERVRVGASQGMFMADGSGDFFGTIETTDANGNKVKIQLGYLTVKSFDQESLREGIFDFDLLLTYLNGARKVNLRGVITTEGKLIFE